MARHYLKNNHVTYYVITQVGVYAEQWYVLRPTWRGTAGWTEWAPNKLLEAGVETSYVHSSINITVKPRYNAVSGRHLLRPRYKRGAL